MECCLSKTLELGTPPFQTMLVVGEILLLHICEDLYADGKIDMKKT